MRQVGAKGKRTSLQLTTLDSEKNPVNANLLDLEKNDLEENVFYNLPTVFTHPKLPVTYNDAAKQEDVDRWSHLAGITIPKIRTNVGLLIGNDHSEIMEPIEIKRGSQGGPYAVRTSLGWVLNGPLRLDNAGGGNKSTVNFIRADENLSQQFKDFCNREFYDSVAETCTEMSRKIEGL